MKIIEHDLGRIIVHLNDDFMNAVDYMNAHFHPYFEDLTNVSNGGHNIWYGPPKKTLDDWSTFDDNLNLKQFVDQFGYNIKEHWSNKSSTMKYKLYRFFWTLWHKRQYSPEGSHRPLADDVTKFEESKIGVKSCIGFIPINPDGMIILLWTDGKRKKYWTLDEMNQDDIRSAQDIDAVPGQYFLYIPHGVFIALPADTIHAGLFVWSKIHVPYQVY